MDTRDYPLVMLKALYRSGGEALSLLHAPLSNLITISGYNAKSSECRRPYPLGFEGNSYRSLELFKNVSVLYGRWLFYVIIFSMGENVVGEAINKGTEMGHFRFLAEAFILPTILPFGVSR